MTRKWWTLIAASIATFMLLLDITVVNTRSEEHTSELQSRRDIVCRLLLETKARATRCPAASGSGRVPGSSRPRSAFPPTCDGDDRGPGPDHGPRPDPRLLRAVPRRRPPAA